MITPAPAHTKLIQRTDYLIATAMLLAALTMFFGSGLVAGTPKAATESLVKRATQLAQMQCVNALQALDVAHTRANDSIRVSEASPRSLPSLVERASLIQQSCPGYELEAFCAGQTCLPENGLSFTLKLNPKEVANGADS